MEIRPHNLPGCVCQFLLSFSRERLLVASCECWYVCVNWSDRGDPPPTTESRKMIAVLDTSGTRLYS